MIIKQEKNLEVETVGENESLTAGINTENMSFMFDLVSKQMYKNPIASVVREITSNCFDSHAEAEVDMPVRIKMGEDDSGYYITFTDYGVGMSPDRIRSIYVKYFSSTKRDTNNQIGSFGLGSKSPLAYTDQFFIITRYEGIEYEYMFHKGEHLPTLEILREDPTTERNGTTIRININNGADQLKFREALRSQLAYFDEIYYEGCGIDNDFTIVEGNTFKYRHGSELRFYNGLHLVLGKVPYPIDFDELLTTNLTDFKHIAVPIAVKFEIGELTVTPSRESIRYTDEAKQLLVKRIQMAVVELLKRWRKQHDFKMDNLYKFMRDDNHVALLNIGEDSRHNPINLDINSITLNKVDFTFDPMPFLSRCNLNPESIANIFNCFKAVKWINNNGNFAEPKRTVNWYLQNNTKVVFLDKEQEKTKTAYLKYVTDVLFVKFEKKTYTEWRKFFNFKEGEVGLARMVKEFKARFPSILACGYPITKYSNRYNNRDYDFHIYSDVIVSPAWLEDYNERKKFKKRHIEGHVSVKVVLYDNVLEEKRYELDYLNNMTGFIIYGFRKDRDKLYQVSTMLNARYGNKDWPNKPRYHVLLITNDVAKFFNKPNMCHVEQLTPKVRVFRNIVTAYKIRMALSSLYENEKFHSVLADLNPGIGYHLKGVQNYVKEHFNKVPLHMDTHKSLEMLNEFTEIAERYNLFDPTIMLSVRVVENYIKKAPLLLHLQYKVGLNDHHNFSEADLENLAVYLKKCGNYVHQRWFKSSLEPVVAVEPSTTGEIIAPEVIEDYDHIPVSV